MKKLLIFPIILFCLSGFAIAENEQTDSAEDAETTALSAEYQADLVARLNHLHGHGPAPESLDTLSRPICGMHTAFEYMMNRDRLDPPYKALVTEDARYPLLTESYVSPEGHFKVHYTTDTTTGDAVYGSEPLVDTIPFGGDGVPDYVNKVGEIADSVYDYQINVLGFPIPPKDDFYPAGGDSLYDIYLPNVGSSFYGATYPGVQVDSQRYTSYLELDNDYEGFYGYDDADGTPGELDRRLDAVRVTMAHEYQHSIHFGMDATEWEGTAATARLYWWEMSAVWMEEAMYDDINDYYGYLPSFFNVPWLSLRYFTRSTLHPYGAGVFPMFLTERYGDSLVTRKIWERCKSLGVGPDFGVALDETIQEISGGEHNIVDAMREFSIWNLFTGDRASQAPSGYGYSERDFYPGMVDTAFFTVDEYPIIYFRNDVDSIFLNKRPEDLSANYIKMKNPSLVTDAFNFRFFVNPDDLPEWSLSLVGFPLDGVSEATVVENEYTGPTAEIYPFEDFRDMLNIIAIPSTSATLFTENNYGRKYSYSFIVFDSLDPGDTVYSFAAPYPNPIRTASGDGTVTFEFEIPPFEDDPGDLEIMIYNLAGEKVREISTQQSPGVLFQAEWDLKNDSGDDVAGGVYLALVRFAFANGREDMIKKYKLAVIR